MSDHAHRYEYPVVAELPIVREPTSRDDFADDLSLDKPASKVMEHHQHGANLEAELEQTTDPTDRARLIEEAYKDLGATAVVIVVTEAA